MSPCKHSRQAVGPAAHISMTPAVCATTWHMQGYSVAACNETIKQNLSLVMCAHISGPSDVSYHKQAQIKHTQSCHSHAEQSKCMGLALHHEQCSGAQSSPKGHLQPISDKLIVGFHNVTESLVCPADSQQLNNSICLSMHNSHGYASEF